MKNQQTTKRGAIRTAPVWLAVLAAVAALTSAQTIRAITFGEPDGDLHPNVGATVAEFPDGSRLLGASGTLIYKGRDHNGIWTGIFLTAGHVTVDVDSLLASGVITKLGVNFNPDPTPCPEQDIRIVDTFTFLVMRPNFYDWDDVGIMVLQVDDPAALPEPAALAPIGFLDQLSQSQLHDSQFVAVGYGASLLFPHPGLVYGDKRQFSTPKYSNLIGHDVVSQVNGQAGNSGTAYGDSGGPLFWKDPLSGAESIVGTSQGGNSNWHSVVCHYRSDAAAVHEFIQAVIDQL